MESLFKVKGKVLGEKKIYTVLCYLSDKDMFLLVGSDNCLKQIKSFDLIKGYDFDGLVS